MTATLIDGVAVSATIRESLKGRVAALAGRGLRPCLAVVLVGEDPASKSYVAGKTRACAELGLEGRDFRLAADTPREELLALIQRLNADPMVHGILVQLPLPRHLKESELLFEINPVKDVDGFHPVNVGRLLLGEKAFLPCTPHGVLQLLDHQGIKTAGAHIVVIGRSNIVGKPLANLLLRKENPGNATVTICHTGTPDIAYHTRQADIVVAAVGRPGTLTGDMIKEGAVVIDVGVNRIPDATKKSGFRLVGDADFESVRARASYLTPVPGGVGPMTITMLLFNTVLAAENFGTR